jgi:molybdenum cofactor cytidylyltransferase
VKTCGVVLAAGAGRRFGGAKQLATLDGRPLLQHAVDAARASPALDRVVVVLGAGADEVLAAVAFGRASVVMCDGWDEGMAASLRCGVAAAADADWIVVTLGDEPALPAGAIDAVVSAARSAAPAVGAVRARWHGRPGHPVALRADLAGRVDGLRGDVGARGLLEQVAVLEVECGALGTPVDVDTPADLEGMRR